MNDTRSAVNWVKFLKPFISTQENIELSASGTRFAQRNSLRDDVRDRGVTRAMNVYSFRDGALTLNRKLRNPG